MRTFTCIYCGNRKAWEKRTDEHFIPQNIYGKFIIREVCRECNPRMGALVDACFPQYIRFAEYHKTGIVITDGIATLGDGSRVEGVLKLVEQRTDNRSYSIVEFTDSDGSKVPQSHIKDVKFLAWDSEDVKTVIPGIAKVAYSSIHYLLNYKHHRFKYRNFVNRRQLEG